MRRAGFGRSSSSRSRERARWAPRLVPATACTSSRITVSMPVSASRAADVSIRNRDSGVVIRMSGGRVDEGAALGGRGVAGADAHLDLGFGQAEADGFLADAGQGAAEVALHVHGEGLERGDVQDAAALLRVGGRGCGGELVQGGEERGQGLAGAGWGDHQHVRALRDGLPRACLGCGGRVERTREPAAGRGGEAVQGSVSGADHASILHPATDNGPDLRVASAEWVGPGRGARRRCGWSLSPDRLPTPPDGLPSPSRRMASA